jgi:hypothetical protein
MDLLALTHMPGLTTGKFYRVEEDIYDKDRYVVFNDNRNKVSLPKYYFGTYEDYKSEKSFEERYSAYRDSKSSSMFPNIEVFSDTFRAIVEKDTAGHSKYSTADQSENNGGVTDYYKLDPEWECVQDIIEDKNMSWNIANVFKSCFRLGGNHHSTKLRDLNKIIYFAERERDLIQKQKSND